MSLIFLSLVNLLFINGIVAMEVVITTCSVDHSASSQTLTVTASGETFSDVLAGSDVMTVDVSASSENIVLQKSGSDGLCIESVKLEGTAICGPFWLDDPCEGNGYSGIDCVGTQKTCDTGILDVVITACSVDHSASSQTLVLTPSIGDAYSNVLGLGEVMTMNILPTAENIVLEKPGSDGLCIESVTVQGSQVCGPFWLDDPCEGNSYSGFDCMGDQKTCDIGSLQALVNKGGSGCTSSNPCDLCEGDCDRDSDCAGELICYQRDVSSDQVPGCVIGGSGDVENYDYCYHPSQVAVGQEALVGQEAGMVYHFGLKGYSGNERVSYVDASGATKEITVSTEFQEFTTLSNPLTVTFLNDGSNKDVYFDSWMHGYNADIMHAGKWPGWNCGSSNENERCQMVRDGVFAWNGAYTITFVGYPFSMKGQSGNERVSYVDASGTTQEVTLTTEFQKYTTFSNPLTVTFLNDGSNKDVYFDSWRHGQSADIMHAGKWPGWNCGSSNENERCQMVRDGIFAWNGAYTIDFVTTSESLTLAESKSWTLAESMQTATTVIPAEAIHAFAFIGIASTAYFVFKTCTRAPKYETITFNEDV